MRRNSKSRGALAFEWIVVCCLLIIGVIGGIATARNAFLYELDDTINVVDAIDASFIVDPESLNVNGE